MRGEVLSSPQEGKQRDEIVFLNSNIVKDFNKTLLLISIWSLLFMCSPFIFLKKKYMEAIFYYKNKKPIFIEMAIWTLFGIFGTLSSIPLKL